jgi:hypothetical protein
MKINKSIRKAKRKLAMKKRKSIRIVLFNNKYELINSLLSLIQIVL